MYVCENLESHVANIQGCPYLFWQYIMRHIICGKMKLFHLRTSPLMHCSASETTNQRPEAGLSAVSHHRLTFLTFLTNFWLHMSITFFHQEYMVLIMLVVVATFANLSDSLENVPLFLANVWNFLKSFLTLIYSSLVTFYFFFFHLSNYIPNALLD